MKVSVIGASGFVGAAIVEELLNRGHVVTAIARDITKIKIGNDQLEVKAADVFDTAALSEVLLGTDVVISAYNAGWTNPNLYQDFIAGSESIQQAAKTADVKRLIVIGGAGSLTIDGHQLVDGPNFPAEYKAGATAARDYLNIIKKETALDWTFFSPAIEMHHGIDTGRTGQYRLGTDSPVFKDGRSVLSVEDLAVVIVDEVEHHKHSRQRFTAAY